MVVLPIVNMLLVLLGFVTPWRKKSPVAEPETARDLTASQTLVSQLTEVVQKG
jgi:hypothetical protein